MILFTDDSFQVTPEAKKKAAEAKARGDEAFKRKDYMTAVDAYTQVWFCLLYFLYIHPVYTGLVLFCLLSLYISSIDSFFIFSLYLFFSVYLEIIS